MAGNSTISITFKLDGDNKGFKELAKDANGFKKVMTSTLSEAQKFNTRAINFAAITTGIDQAQQSLVQMQAMFKGLADAYAVQITAERQLETVMRQRMEATDAEIQSIKDLASAQQALGIIGDEVQLSGAQQLATFLTERESLVALLPALNNLLAQQKGLNATNQDAINIGNLLGKAMMGQTASLRRVGITFDAAEDAAVKYGTELERAATLAQIITNNVGQMNAELAKTDPGKQKQLENTLGDLQEKLGELTKGALPFLTVAANVTVVAGGIAKLAVTVKTATGAVAAMHLGSKAASAGVLALGVSTRHTTAVTRIFSGALKSGAYSATAFKLALRGLMISTGVGIAIMALTSIIEALSNTEEEATGNAKQLNEANKAYKSAAAGAKAEIDKQIRSLGALIAAKKDTTAAVKELNRTYGDIFGRYQTASAWYDTLTKKSKIYAKQVGYEAQARILATNIAEKEIELETLYARAKELRESGRDTEEKRVLGTYWNAAGQRVSGFVKKQVDTEEYADLKTAIAGARTELGSLNSQLGIAQTKLGEAASEMDGIRDAAEKANGVLDVSKMNLAQVAEAITETETALKNTTDGKEIAQLKAYNAQLHARRDALQQIIGLAAKRAAASKTPTAKDTEPLWREDAANLKEIGENIAILNKQLQTATVEEAALINKQIEKWQEKADAIKKAGKAETSTGAPAAVWKDDASTLAEIEDNLAVLSDKLQGASIQEASAINQQIDLWQEKADAIRAAGRATEEANASAADSFAAGWGAVRRTSDSVMGLTDAINGNGNAWQTVCGIIDGVLGMYEGFQTISKIIKLLSSASAAHAAAKTAEAGAVAGEATAQAAATAVIVPASAARTAANIIEAASWSQLAAAQTFAAHAWIPFAGTAIAASFVATQQALIAAAAIPKFAEGGIAFGPTLGLFGEYPGAGNNPEVVAPLDKLRNMLDLGPRNDGGRVEFTIKGRTLVGILNKENNHEKRS